MLNLVDRLKNDFKDKDYRHGYVDEFLNSSIATQIKVLRDLHGWSQDDLADKSGMKQPTISRIENVNYSSWSINTLRKIAEAFDLTLRVTFEDFGTRLGDISRFSKEALERYSFEDDPAFKERQEGEPSSSQALTKSSATGDEIVRFFLRFTVGSDNGAENASLSEALESSATEILSEPDEIELPHIIVGA